MSHITVLMVAEKPSICNSVAEALYKSARHSGKPISRNKSPPVYEFESTFLGKPATFRITSVTGHLYSLDFPSSYQSWDKVDPADLFSAPTMKTTDGKGGIIKHLEREAKGTDALVLWMDCDREGENICFEVIHTIEQYMKKAPNQSNIVQKRILKELCNR
jgi:DNA topoisomerase-3